MKRTNVKAAPPLLFVTGIAFAFFPKPASALCQSYVPQVKFFSSVVIVVTFLTVVVCFVTYLRTRQKAQIASAQTKNASVSRKVTMIVSAVLFVSSTALFVYASTLKSTCDDTGGGLPLIVPMSFAECAVAGNPVQESYPRRCTANGVTYTEEVGNANRSGNVNANPQTYTSTPVKKKISESIDYHFTNTLKNPFTNQTFMVRKDQNEESCGRNASITCDLVVQQGNAKYIIDDLFFRKVSLFLQGATLVSFQDQDTLVIEYGSADHGGGDQSMYTYNIRTGLLKKMMAFTYGETSTCGTYGVDTYEIQWGSQTLAFINCEKSAGAPPGVYLTTQGQRTQVASMLQAPYRVSFSIDKNYKTIGSVALVANSTPLIFDFTTGKLDPDPTLYSLECLRASDTFAQDHAWYPHFSEQMNAGWTVREACLNEALQKVVYVQEQTKEDYQYNANTKEYGKSQLGIYDITTDRFTKAPIHDLSFYESCGIIKSWFKAGTITYQCGAGDGGAGTIWTYSYTITSNNATVTNTCYIENGENCE